MKKPKKWRRGALVVVDRGGGGSTWIGRIVVDDGSLLVFVDRYVAASHRVERRVTVHRARIRGLAGKDPRVARAREVGL